MTQTLPFLSSVGLVLLFCATHLSCNEIYKSLATFDPNEADGGQSTDGDSDETSLDSDSIDSESQKDTETGQIDSDDTDGDTTDTETADDGFSCLPTVPGIPSIFVGGKTGQFIRLEWQFSQRQNTPNRREFFTLTMQGEYAPNGPGDYPVVEGGDFENGIWLAAGIYEDELLVERYGVFEGTIHISKWSRSPTTVATTHIEGTLDVIMYQRELENDNWTIDGCRDRATAAWSVSFSD